MNVSTSYIEDPVTKNVKNMIPKATAVGNKMTLVQSRIPSQLQRVTSVEKVPYKGISNSI